MDSPSADIFDLVHESLFVRGPDGRIRSWNAASEALYGVPRAEAVGRPADDLLGTDHPRPLADLEAELLAAGSWEGELARRGPKGETLVIEARWSLRRDVDGVPVEIIETGRDITARRSAEAALKRSEHRYRNLFQAMAAAFWELDFFPVGAMLRDLKAAGVTDFPAHFSGHPQFVRDMMRATRVVDVNDQAVALFGRGGDKAEMLTNVEPFWPEASTAVYAASVIAAVTGQPNYAAETKLRTIDGRELDVLFTACFPPETMNKGTLLIGVLDITARKAADAALERVQAEFAHAARVSMLGELTASIAHEVNQPLAAIATNGSAGLRWLDRPEPDLAEVRSLTARIVGDAHRAAAIIARVREIAAGRAPQKATLSINAVVREATAFLGHEIKAQGAELVLDLAPGLPPVLADRTQLQQVVVNLAVNALQAMSQAGAQTGAQSRRLTVRTAPLGSDGVQVLVLDTGPGVAAEDRARLFESFVTTKADGMGMGLPICRSILEAHGGAIEVQDRAEGPGACFSVRLPAAPDHTKV